MKKKLIVTFVLFLIIVCVTICLVIAPGRYSQCELKDLVMDVDMMPGEWNLQYTVKPPIMPDMGAQDARRITMYPGYNDYKIAHHTVYRYWNGIYATMLFYLWNERAFFPLGEWNWYALDESKDWKLKGNVLAIKCVESDWDLMGSSCAASVRHGPYLSNFTTPIKKGAMSQKDFGDVVKAIDARIDACLNE